MGFLSGSSTHGGSNVHANGNTIWSNFSGTKESHDVQADKMNVKREDGTHDWYNPRTGEQGEALGSERQRDW